MMNFFMEIKMLSFYTNGGRLGETINFLYGIFKFCKINNIPYTEIVVPINYKNTTFLNNEISSYVYRENMELFQNIKYIFKPVGDEYFKDFDVVDLCGKTDLAQFKNFYLYNPSYIGKNIIFKNWWSLEKYWILKDPLFDLNILNYICRPDKIKNKIYKKFKKLLKKKNVAIHVRRGDYIVISQPQLLKNEYVDIQKAIFENKVLYTENDVDNLIKTNVLKGYNVLVFSDDIDWCKKRFHCYKNTYFLRNKPYEDMILMSLCDNVIINPGSLFSMVAYLLSKKC